MPKRGREREKGHAGSSNVPKRGCQREKGHAGISNGARFPRSALDLVTMAVFARIKFVQYQHSMVIIVLGWRLLFYYNKR